ncbi:hypothetical protein LINPERHAP2_LOCUS14197 [Linum perenne]
MVRMDLATTQGARARYARVWVEVDISRPLLGKYIIEDRVYHVEYESLENICFSCGIYGHKEEGCPTAKADVRSTPDAAATQLETPDKGEPNCGSWMTVKRR